MKNSDSPANPTLYQDLTNGSGEMYCDNTGLTKRESFAMAAMQGFCTCAVEEDMSDKIIAKFSVKVADALLKELAKNEP